MSTDDRMTICLVSRALSPEAHSGVARATWELAGALGRAGHAVHLVTRSGELPADAPPGVSVDRVLAPPLLAPAALAGEPVADHLSHAAAVHRAVTEIHEREHVDAVLAPLWCCEGVVCGLDERFPTVVSCMTSMATIEELRQRPALDGEAAQLIALERATMRRARYAHGLTTSALEKTLADYGAEPAETGVVGRGLSDRAQTRNAAPDAADPPLVLFVGRLERRKGVDVLLEAAKLLAADDLRFSLVLVGPDSDDTDTGEPYRLRFERGAGRDRALAGRVQFAGAVTDDELHRLYGGADVVCVPSRFESHGVVLVEAMMHGRAIVTCDAGGVPEVIEEDGNALLARPGDPDSLADCLRRVVGDSELRGRLGARSRALFEERFEAGRVGERMAGFLARVARAHRAAPTAVEDLCERLAAVLQEVLPVDSATAAGAAAELIEPSAASWRAAAVAAAGERDAWQARALEAERQREAAEASIDRF